MPSGGLRCLLQLLDVSVGRECAPIAANETLPSPALQMRRAADVPVPSPASPVTSWMLALRCQTLDARLATTSRRTTARQLPAPPCCGLRWWQTSSSARKSSDRTAPVMAAAANGGGGAAAAPAGPPSEYEPYLEVALAAAREAGAVIADAWNAPKKIDTKSGAQQAGLRLCAAAALPPAEWRLSRDHCPWALACCTAALLAESHASHHIVADTDKQRKVLMPGGCKRMLCAGPCAAGDADWS